MAEVNMHLCKALPWLFSKLYSHLSRGGKVEHEHSRTHSFPITPSSPSHAIKICQWSPCDSRCHHCLLSTETVGLFQQRVTRSPALQTSERQRSSADSAKTYCALRSLLRSEQLTDFTLAGSREIAISIQGQHPCFKSHLIFFLLSGFAKKGCDLIAVWQ